MRNHHFLLLSFPALGHMNPSLQLAHRLIDLGVHVTFATTTTAIRRINKTRPPPTLSFATISDGSDDDDQTTFQLDGADPALYFSDLSRHGSQSLTHLITSTFKQSHSRPITFVIYSQPLTWVADVAATLDIPSALFFVQPAAVLTLYHHYFHGYAEKLELQQHNPYSCVELRGLPLLSPNDIPSFLSPSSPHAFIIPLLKNQLEFLHQRRGSKVLLNTFDELEEEALRAVDEFKMVAVGPLVPSASASFDSTEDCCCIEWLNSKAESLVVYVSFGSMCVLSDEQEAEIMDALVGSGYNFLWVMRCGENNNEEEKEMKELGGRGKIVRWCNQVQVLNHPSLGCFVTHCGWNSTLESLVYGVPVIGFPQQIDQATNAKLMEDVWKTGVRVKANAAGIVEREEIRRCLDIVMGDTDVQKREEIEGNVKKWKELGREAIGQGGSSYLNLQTFISEIDG